jgi:predicted HAD superfamily Cof-like phosphohydrolase
MKAQLDMVGSFLYMKDLLTPGDSPQAISTKQLIDRHHLMTEELSEYLQAGDSGDLELILDALVDLQYLLFGTVLAHGMQDVFTEAFRRVHIANLGKKPGVQSTRKLLSTDVIKPKGWEPATFEDLVK